MTLLADFRDEARRRGLLGPGDAVTVEAAYRLVRDMPYGRASDRRPETAIAEWRGTPPTKHVLLAALLDELGYDALVIVSTHEFDPQSEPWLPPHLAEEAGRAPVPDIHAFLRVRAGREGDNWTTVDATWPLAARALGLPANEAFRPGENQRVACAPIQLYHVPDDEEPDAFMERLGAEHAGEQAERRDRFIDELSAWLAERIPATSA